MSGYLSLSIAELDVPRCTLTHGVAPCTSTTTGDDRCYNCAETCLDVANFTPETQTIRWVENSMHVPVQEIFAQPCITENGIKTSAQAIKPGEDLGKRETGSVTLKNIQHNDVGFDDYLSSRTYNPWDVGSYFGKFAARYPNIEGYQLRIKRGVYDPSLSTPILDQLDTYHYVVQSSGIVGANAGYEIKFIDALSFVEGKKQLYPQVSNGLLSTDIATGLVSFDLAPSGIGSEYPAAGYASMSKEYVSYTISGDTVTLTGRGLRGSEESEQDAETTFQIAGVLESKSCAEVLDTLLQNTETPSEYRDLSTWSEECDNYAPQRLTAHIAEPTPVGQLVQELMKDNALSIYANISTKKIIMRVLKQEPSSFFITDDIATNLSPSMDSGSVINAAYIRYGRRNPLEKMDETQNYSGHLFYLADNPNAALAGNTSKFLSHNSRWLPGTLRQVATRTGGIMTARYNSPLRSVKCTLPLQKAPAIGAVGTLRSRVFEDKNGRFASVPVQVVSRTSGSGFASVELKEYSVNYFEEIDPGVRLVSLVDDINNANMREIYNAVWGAGEITSGTTVKFVVSADDVVFGSSSSSSPAISFAAEDWPEIDDISIIFDCATTNFLCAGKGGNGGFGGFGSAAQAGGTALRSRIPITFIGGELGGGGGGGAGVTITSGEEPLDFRGGGGAGRNVGFGYENGTLRDGGEGFGPADRGGDLGDNGGGSNGGAAGFAIDGASFVTLSGTTVTGPTTG